MDYEHIIQFLFSQLAVYQRDGASAYKPGLQTASALSSAFSCPEKAYPTIHIAGTNGKGSTAHTLAAILQSAGYRTGLFTSPHLVDFRERIRVDGAMIFRDGVVGFMERYFGMDLPLRPSFFELTATMAFDWFRSCDVDVAVIETGLGGRLDSTNIISPVLSVITNISLDHTDLLGSTLELIAAEKAGIIKEHVPVVVGEASGKVLDVFSSKAAEMRAPLILPEAHPEIARMEENVGSQTYHTLGFGAIRAELTGECQRKNAETVLAAVKALRQAGFVIPDSAVARGFEKVCAITGLMGRWTVLQSAPTVIADTGHNVGGWSYTVRRLAAMPGVKRLVIGFVNDKDISSILSLIASVPSLVAYPTAPLNNRALPADTLRALMQEARIATSGAFPEASLAYEKALADAGESDIILIGGSNFVVADFLNWFNPSRR